MKAIMKYPGSKWSLSNWIISRFPDHHSYLEPFFGSGAVLFNKPRSNIETVNDLDGNVVNFLDGSVKIRKGLPMKSTTHHMLGKCTMMLLPRCQKTVLKWQ